MRIPAQLTRIKRTVATPFQWLFIRLPKGFSYPMLTSNMIYFFFIFPLLAYIVLPVSFLVLLYFVFQLLLNVWNDPQGAATTTWIVMRLVRVAIISGIILIVILAPIILS